MTIDSTKKVRTPMMKRYAGLLSLVLLLGGCWGSPASQSVLPAVTSDMQVISASNAARGGSLQISIVPMDGEERSVQATPRGKKAADIKGYTIEVIEPGATNPRFTYSYAGTKTKFRIDNIAVTNAGGDNLIVRIRAFSDVTWTQNITEGGKADSPNFTLKDQQLSTTSVTLKLLGGATANGDVLTTVGVQDGDETAPETTITPLD
jgi:hypothetical protein